MNLSCVAKHLCILQNTPIPRDKSFYGNCCLDMHGACGYKIYGGLPEGVILEQLIAQLSALKEDAEDDYSLICYLCHDVATGTGQHNAVDETHAPDETATASVLLSTELTSNILDLTSSVDH
jgi:hypothetical protein